MDPVVLMPFVRGWQPFETASLRDQATELPTDGAVAFSAAKRDSATHRRMDRPPVADHASC